MFHANEIFVSRISVNIIKAMILNCYCLLLILTSSFISVLGVYNIYLYEKTIISRTFFPQEVQRKNSNLELKITNLTCDYLRTNFSVHACSYEQTSKLRIVFTINATSKYILSENIMVIIVKKFQYYSIHKFKYCLGTSAIEFCTAKISKWKICSFI